MDDAGQRTSIELRAADGATAEIHLHGAHVTSWRPAPGGSERLFLSERSGFSGTEAIRGGIPVIFPQFAGEGPLPRHGFARTSRWTLDSSGFEPGGDAIASFSLEDSLEIRKVWAARFRAIITVRVGGRTLVTSLAVENTGSDPLNFTAALHTYLRVRDVREAEVAGLEGTRYRESRAPDHLTTDDQPTILIHGEIDRVYVDAPARVTLRDGDRTLDITTTNFPDVVIWNPGAEKAAAMKDMEPDGDRRMLCIEAAAAQRPVRLEAGGSWSGTQTLTAEPHTE